MIQIFRVIHFWDGAHVYPRQRMDPPLIQMAQAVEHSLPGGSEIYGAIKFHGRIIL